MPQPSSTPENVRRKSNTWVVAFMVGLVVGVGLSIAGSILFICPFTTQEVLFAINPVQVSGTVSVTQKGTIQFVNDNETASTRYGHHVPIVDGHYSIVLSGGYSYKVYIGTGQTSPSYTFSLYVPSNVTTLIADFPP
ncbi:MAG: hypothetical protein JSW72_07320 [Candidatus Bathyarchaeota archaeon]|nr:MAG: hypothetical protein JSW72_07320 [Candidatus Bathyarchaeota archaeon]